MTSSKYFWSIIPPPYPAPYKRAQRSIISMASCKTAVTPVRQQWSYCSLALNHRSVLRRILHPIETCPCTLTRFDRPKRLSQLAHQFCMKVWSRLSCLVAFNNNDQLNIVLIAPLPVKKQTRDQCFTCHKRQLFSTLQKTWYILLYFELWWYWSFSKFEGWHFYDNNHRGGRLTVTDKICTGLCRVSFRLYQLFGWMRMTYLPIFFRVILLAKGQSYDCPSASEVPLQDVAKIDLNQIKIKRKESVYSLGWTLYLDINHLHYYHVTWVLQPL